MKEVLGYCPFCSQMTNQLAKSTTFNGEKLWSVFCRKCKKTSATTTDYSDEIIEE